MTRLVQRSDIIDFATYEDSREQVRDEVMEAKRARRVHLNDNLTFLFENRQTLIHQIQEIMRAERIVREADIANEIETYNSILGEPGDLGCVLLIEIPDEADRKPLLIKWLGLQEHLYVVMKDQSRVYATFDPSQVGDDRLSAVQYLRFPVQGEVPIAVGSDFAELVCEVPFSDEQGAALAADLAS